jgi:hypothetical protein
MPNIKFSDLTANPSIADTDLFAVSKNGGGSRKETAENVRDWAVKDEQQVYSVGKEGSNTNSGLNINNKMDEPATAVTAITTLRGAWTPVPAGAISIESKDGGTYNSFNLTSPGGEYVYVNFPNGVLSSDNVNLTQNSSIRYKSWDTITNGSVNVTKTGAGSSTVYGETMTAAVAGASGNTNIYAGPGRLTSHVDHLVSSLDPADKSIHVINDPGTTSEVFHRGFTADNLLQVDANSYANVSLSDFSGDLLAQTSGNIALSVSGLFEGSITTKPAGNVTLICGSRDPSGVSGDSLSVTSTVRKLVAKGDTCVVDGMHALSYPVQEILTSTYSLAFFDAGQILGFNRATSGNLTFTLTSGNIPVGGQGEFYNSGSGPWSFATSGAATLTSNQPITPIVTNEYVRWFKNSTTDYYLHRSPSNYTRLLSGSLTSTVLTPDRRLVMVSLTANVTIQISTLDVQSGTPSNPRHITIRDASGNCGTYTITISLESGTINGASTFVMAVPYGSITLVMDGTNAGIE